MNRIWVNNHVCSLPYNIYVVTLHFVTIDNRFKLFQQHSIANNFCEFKD